MTIRARDFASNPSPGRLVDPSGLPDNRLRLAESMDMLLVFDWSRHLRQVRAVLERHGIPSAIEVMPPTGKMDDSSASGVPGDGLLGRLTVAPPHFRRAVEVYRAHLDEMAARSGHPFASGEPLFGPDGAECPCCMNRLESASVAVCPVCGLRFVVSSK
jgi:hypothetical protein